MAFNKLNKPIKLKRDINKMLFLFLNFSCISSEIKWNFNHFGMLYDNIKS